VRARFLAARARKASFLEISRGRLEKSRSKGAPTQEINQPKASPKTSAFSDLFLDFGHVEASEYERIDE
jgi:hypothetical protein